MHLEPLLKWGSSSDRKRLLFEHRSIWAHILCSLRNLNGDEEKAGSDRITAQAQEAPSLGICGCPNEDEVERLQHGRRQHGWEPPPWAQKVNHSHKHIQEHKHQRNPTLEQQPQSSRFQKPGFCAPFVNTTEFCGFSLKPTYHVTFWSQYLCSSEYPTVQGIQASTYLFFLLWYLDALNKNNSKNRWDTIAEQHLLSWTDEIL